MEQYLHNFFLLNLQYIFKMITLSSNTYPGKSVKVFALFDSLVLGSVVMGHKTGRPGIQNSKPLISLCGEYEILRISQSGQPLSPHILEAATRVRNIHNELMRALLSETCHDAYTQWGWQTGYLLWVQQSQKYKHMFVYSCNFNNLVVMNPYTLRNGPTFMWHLREGMTRGIIFWS
jgi:hypothetical protein